MGLQDTWNEVDEHIKNIQRAVSDNNTAEAIDRIQSFYRKYGKSYSDYIDDKENEYWGKEQR